MQSNPLRGFWVVSAASLAIAPFLTNDGVCLLFVEIILNAFEDENDADAPAAQQDVQLNELGDDKSGAPVLDTSALPYESSVVQFQGAEKLRRSDAIYFLLSLACSANIGSALTYTGNPQVISCVCDIIRLHQLVKVASPQILA